MALRRIKVDLTTDASGDGTATFYANGELLGYLYEPGTLDLGADLTIKDYETDIKLAVGTNMGTAEAAARFVAATATTTAGMGLVHASNAQPGNPLTIGAGIPAFSYSPPIVAGRTTVVIAQGGASKAGSITFLVRTL